MPIPEFDDNVLPEGVHDCTFEELEARFGRFQKSDRRIRLTERLKEYFHAARQSGIVKSVIVDGSYAMNKDEPSDIDIIAVLTDEFDWAQDLKPFQENVINKKAIRRDYRFDGFAYQQGQPELQELIANFAVVPDKHVGLTAKTHKGMVRVNL
jgi:Family of unknown function (DUF6932)